MAKLLKKSEQEAVQYFKKRLKDKFGREVVDIRLFGSKARGESHRESDVDLLILVKRRTEALDDFIIDLVCDALNEFGVYLETVTYAEGDYQRDLRAQYPFFLNVERESVAV